MLRLHNRIQLLEAEEERAVKIIEDTKQKVKQILKTRAENEAHQRELEQVREKEIRKRQRAVKSRHQALMGSHRSNSNTPNAYLKFANMSSASRSNLPVEEVNQEHESSMIHHT